MEDPRITNAPYKSKFYDSLIESKLAAQKPFWHSEAEPENTNLPQEKPKINLMTKVTTCHDIWKSEQYTDSNWRPYIYQSVYKTDFVPKYSTYHPEILI